MPRGRKPKATAVKEAEGSFTRHPERRNHLEPVVKVERPEPSENIKSDPASLAAFNHVVDCLVEMRVAASVDRDLIEAYAAVYVELWENVLAMRQEGQVVDGARGGMVRNPRAVIVGTLRNQQVKMLAEMGLTPSSRSRLKAAPDDSEDIFAQLMKKRESLN